MAVATGRHCLPLKVCVVTLLVPAAFSLDAIAATKVLGKRANEFGAVASVKSGKRYLAWSQSPANRPANTRVLARRGGKTIRVSAKGSVALSGGMSGAVVIYQQKKKGDIFGYNIRKQKRFKFKGPSTRHAELAPTMTRRWLLFGRELSGRDVVILYNRKTGRGKKIANVKTNNGGDARPGQVNGRWAVFQKCSPGSCRVYRYNIKSKKTNRIPNRRPYQYAPSVSRNGDTFFAGSGRACGSHVRIFRRRHGRTRTIAKLGRMDTLKTYAGPAPGKRSNVFFDKSRCTKSGVPSRHPHSDVYRVRA